MNPRLANTIAYLAQWAIDYKSDYIVATPVGGYVSNNHIWQTWDVVLSGDTAKDFRLFRWVKE